MRFGKVTSVVAMSVAVVALAACGGSSSKKTGGSSGGSAADSIGPITYVQGKDNNGTIAPLVAAWNKDHPDEKVTLKEQSDKADEQHNDLVEHFKAKSADYDLVSVDLVWTAEFAAQQWLQPLTDKYALDTSKMVQPAVKGATYVGKLYAGPTSTDGGMLYYRKDLVKTPPKTQAQMVAMCPIAKSHGMDCYAGQFAKYEGLTVNAAEAINTAGGIIVKDDGKTPDVDTDAARKGLSFLATNYKNGNIPKAAISYQEEQGRQSFENGKLLFMRQWPYAYSLASTDKSSKIKGKFAVAPLPGLDGPGKSSLGGHNAAISAFSDHKLTALHFLQYFESDAVQKSQVQKASSAPILSALYDDPELVKQFPFLPVLKQSVANAVPRPVTPFYPAVTGAIQENAYAAIKGEKTVEQAVKDMQAAIASATGTK